MSQYTFITAHIDSCGCVVEWSKASLRKQEVASSNLWSDMHLRSILMFCYQNALCVIWGGLAQSEERNVSNVEAPGSKHLSFMHSIAQTDRQTHTHTHFRWWVKRAKIKYFALTSICARAFGGDLRFYSCEQNIFASCETHVTRIKCQFTCQQGTW